MKYINLLCNSMELHCLFPTAKLLELDKVLDSHINLKIDYNGEIVDINHYIDSEIFLKIQNCKNILEMDSLYVNPKKDLTIVCDRKLWYELYFPILKYKPELFLQLENLYLERNVTVFFNFAILEAVNYEDEGEYFLYDFKFNHIKITDYELFKNKKNFYYNSFYNLYHLLAEGQMSQILFPNSKHGYFEYLINFEDMFNNFNIDNRIYRNKIYTHTCLKPRYHRIKFLLECNKHNILDIGLNNVNVQFLEEYKFATFNNHIYTDNTTKHSLNHKKYFNKEFYNEFLKIVNKINITPNDPKLVYDHLQCYFGNKEYNNAYIDVIGETHCIFDLKYGFFTEKSIKPIISENFCMIYGSNKVYTEYKKIGIDLFLNEFGLNGIEDKDELEQIDLIVNSLKSIDRNELIKLYINKHNIIKLNKKKLFNHYCTIINNVNILLLKNKMI